MVVDVSATTDLDREAGVEFFPGILAPGFFNAHCHLELSGLRGAIPPGGGFTAFARGMREARASGECRVKSEELARGAAAFWDSKMWAEGVSAVADVCNGSATFALKHSSRIGYHNFCELFGLNADPARAFELRDHALAGGLHASVTPHSTYSLNRDALPQLLTPHSSLFTLHFLESEDEVDLYRRKGAMWDWYQEQGLAPDFLDFGSPAERLVAQVPPDCPVMLVHNCVATQRDIDIVMGHFTAPVTWVLCPGSNRYIGNPAPPVDLLRKNGLRIAVGTDSLASNDTLSMINELSLIKGVPLAEMLSWASVDVIAPGHTPGFVLITGVDMSTLSLTPSSGARRII
jgi:cytosine/adenosine deaminase-related metal-dependent hydrolase